MPEDSMVGCETGTGRLKAVESRCLRFFFGEFSGMEDSTGRECF